MEGWWEAALTMCSEAEVEQMEEEKHDDSMGLEGEGEGKYYNENNSFKRKKA